MHSAGDSVAELRERLEQMQKQLNEKTLENYNLSNVSVEVATQCLKVKNELDNSALQLQKCYAKLAGDWDNCQV